MLRLARLDAPEVLHHIMGRGIDAEICFKHYDRFKTLIEDFVQPHYWDAIDYMRLRF